MQPDFIRETDWTLNARPRKVPGMFDPVSENVRILFAQHQDAGGNQESFAQLVGTSQPTVNRWLKGRNQPTGYYLKRLAQLAGMEVHEFRYRLVEGSRATVPIVGEIGIGEMVVLLDHAQNQPLQRVKPPPGYEAQGLEAVTVAGNALRPIEPGWLIFFNTLQPGVAAECLGELCILELADGSRTLKRVRRGPSPGRYNLESFSAGVGTLEDQEVKASGLVISITRPPV